MKKILIIICLMLFPVLVNAENTVLGSAIIDDNEIESKVKGVMTPNDSLKNVTSGTFVQGVGVTCKSNKNEWTLLNGSLVCQNGNENPYMKVTGSGLENNFKKDSECNETSNTYYAYGTITYEYDCLFTGSDNNKQEYKPSTGENKNDQPTNKDDDTTMKPTGTTDNKDTGIEDYFAVLTVIGISLITVLYILDKNNVFKRI